MFISRRLFLRKKPQKGSAQTLASKISAAMGSSTSQDKISNSYNSQDSHDINVAKQEQKYASLYKINKTQNVIPELKAPIKYDPVNYPAPKFNPKKDVIVTNSKELIQFNKVDTAVSWPVPIWTVEKIVNFLKDHRLSDVCVIRTDPPRGGTDYMILASGLSRRHISIVGEELHSQFKRDLRDAYLEDNLIRFEPNFTSETEFELGDDQDHDDDQDQDQLVSFKDQKNRAERILNFLEAKASIEGARGTSDWVCINAISSVIHLMTDFSRDNLCLEELHLLNHHDPYSTTMQDDREHQEEVQKMVNKLMATSTDPEAVYDSLADEYMADSSRYDEEELQSSYGTNVQLNKSSATELGLNYNSEDIEAIRQDILSEFNLPSEDYNSEDLIKDFDLSSDSQHQANLKIMDEFINKKKRQKGIVDYASLDDDNFFSYKIDSIVEESSNQSIEPSAEKTQTVRELTEADKFLLKKISNKSDKENKSREDLAEKMLDDL